MTGEPATPLPGAQIVPLTFSIAVEPGPDATRISPAGELDVVTSAELERKLSELVGSGLARIVIDLRDVVFMDSSGLHIVLDTHARSRREGWELKLIAGPPTVQRTFELTGTVDALPFVEPSGENGFGGPTPLS